MRKVKIYLGDLCHTSPLGTAVDAFPLNCGFLGAYANHHLPGQLEVRIFKYPNDLLDALDEERPDILALSNYPWNRRLSEGIFRMCKERYPQTVTVFGGPNFPYDLPSQERFLRPSADVVDFYVILEAEESFRKLIEAFIDRGPDPARMKSEPLMGCAYFHDPNGPLTVTPLPPRFTDMSSIPSPYLSGTLDEFFERKMSPMIQTTRGCPFSCAFCTEGERYYSKVGLFELDRVREEVAYIARRVRNSQVLIITDSNFGMYPRDVEVARVLRDATAQYNYPASVWATTGKNNKDRVFEVVKLLDNRLRVSATVQSMDSEVLVNVRRKNIPPEQFLELQERVLGNDMASYAEMILGLPGDSKEKHLNGYRYLTNSWINYVNSYNFMLLEATHLNTPAERERYQMMGRFRVLPRAFGEYRGRKIFDVEEIVVQTNTLKFEETIEMRLFHVLQDLIYNSAQFLEFLRYARERGIDPIDVVRKVQARIGGSSPFIQNQAKTLLDNARGELFETPEALRAFYTQPENYAALARGEIGLNLLQSFSGNGLTRGYRDWTQAIKAAILAILEERGSTDLDENRSLLSQIEKHLLYRIIDLSHFEPGDVFSEPFEVDIVAWREEHYSRPLASYRTPGLIYRYHLSQEQADILQSFVNQFGLDNSHALGRFYSRVMPHHLQKQVFRSQSVASSRAVSASS